MALPGKPFGTPQRARMTATTMRTTAAGGGGKSGAAPAPDAESTPFSVSSTADVFAVRKNERREKDDTRAARNAIVSTTNSSTTRMPPVPGAAAASASGTGATGSRTGSGGGRRLSATAGAAATASAASLASSNASSSIIPVGERHLYHANRTNNALGTGLGAGAGGSTAAAAILTGAATAGSAAGGGAASGRISGAVSVAGSGAGGAAGAGAVGPRPKGKELIREWIDHKKSLFRFKTSIETKRQEIEKLREEFMAREEAVKKAADMLDTDFSLFEAFVRKNDGKLAKKLNKADEATKAKLTEMKEIKILHQKLADVAQVQEQNKAKLQLYKEYKTFLDGLAPPEYKERIAMLQAKKRRLRSGSAAGSDTAAAAAAATEAAGGDSKRGGQSSTAPDGDGDDGGGGGDNPDDAGGTGTGTGTAAGSGGIGSGRRAEEDSDDDDDVAIDMHFRHPTQLDDIFTQHEETALFVIQNLDKQEAWLADLRQKYAELTNSMELDKLAADKKIEDVQSKIQREEERADALRKRKEAHVIASSQQEVLKHLAVGERGVGVELLYRASFAREANKHSAAAVAAYQAANNAAAAAAASGNSAAAASSSSSASGGGAGGAVTGASSEYIVLMLKEVEKRLEVLLGVVKQIPTPLKKYAIKTVDDQKSADRRTAALQKNHDDEAARKLFYAQRAQMEVFKRTGKPIMTRSHIVRRKKVTATVKKQDEHAEDVKKFLDKNHYFVVPNTNPNPPPA